MNIDRIKEIIENPQTEFYKKREQLYQAAESCLVPLSLSENTDKLVQDGVICGLFEGNAPYRPRYVLPDYAVFLRQGSEYLELAAPRDIFEAINALLVIYRYVPSITAYPVYLGQVDELLEPFTSGVDDNTLRSLLKMFIVNISRTMPNRFVHYNIGPGDTRVGRIIIELERQLKQSEPNLTMKADASTSEDYLCAAVVCALETGKPYMVNHAREMLDWGENYGIASCYNALPVGGGSYTLVRLNLRAVAIRSRNQEDFFARTLPEAMKALFEVIDKRVDYLVNSAQFFAGSFLAREGLIARERFTAMCGMFGLFECVSHLTDGKELGRDDQALTMAKRVLETMRSMIDAHKNSLCINGRFVLHAQSGISDDVYETAGARVAVGKEPDTFKHVRTAAALQGYVNGGVSDIFIFENTAKNNPQAVLSIIKAAFAMGVKLFAFNSEESELIRVSGYLVKRSDYLKAQQHNAILSDTAALAQQAIDGQGLLNRKVKRLNNF